MTGQPRGFTLIEILIVIMMLGILAAIVVPRLLDAQDDARESAIETDIQMVRRQIQVYKAQHVGKGPHLDEFGNPDFNNLPARLIGKTDLNGKINANGAFGPYMKMWPINPYTSNPIKAGTISFGTDIAPPRDESSGWYYNTKTCVLSANSANGAKTMDP